MMKTGFTIFLCLTIICGLAQNVGIGTASPTERLHVVNTADMNKNAIYGYAAQSASSTADYQNTAITGLGQGNGVAGGGAGSYGYGIGVKGIGSPNGFGAIGVYAGIAAAVPNIVLGNGYYALYADAGTPSSKNYAGIFMNGNVGIGTNIPTERLFVTNTSDINKNTIFGYAAQSAGASSDYQNTAITGFGQGNGVGGNGPTSYGYGIGVKAIGSNKSYGAIGLYAAIASSVPSFSSGNVYYALYADAGTPATNTHAAVFLHGNVGIGTNSPLARLQVLDSNVVFSATGDIPVSTGDVGVSGAGRRMLWYPGKAAFRVGYVASTRWNAINIGDYSVAMGYDPLASADSSIAIGNHVIASGNASVALGNYVSTNSQNGAFVLGDNSTTVTMLSATDNSMRARFANGYRFYTSSDYSTNCLLAGGSNAWSTSSDVRLKENFEEADGEDFLHKIEGFNLGSWNYRRQDPKFYRHYGPMAQDFFEAFGKDSFGTIGNDTTINQADFDGINLIAIQALVKRTAELKTENEQLKHQLADMQQKLENNQYALVQKIQMLEGLIDNREDKSLHQ